MLLDRHVDRRVFEAANAFARDRRSFTPPVRKAWMFAGFVLAGIASGWTDALP